MSSLESILRKFPVQIQSQETSKVGGSSTFDVSAVVEFFTGNILKCKVQTLLVFREQL